MLHSAGLYTHAKTQKKYSCISKKMTKKPIFWHLIPANPWIILIETVHLGQMLHSDGLYDRAKYKKIYSCVSKKMSKT